MLVKNIGVFISGGGSNLQSIIDNMDSINGEIKLILSNKDDAYGLVRGKNAGIESISLEKYTDNYNEKVLEECEKRDLDLIVLAGYLKIFDEEFIKRYKNRIINIHPALLPSFGGKGYYGLNVHKKVYDSGVKLTGATVHFIDEKIDTGPIILQESVKIGYDDSIEEIQKKVLEIEHRILPEAIRLYCEDRLEIIERRVKIL